MTVLNLMKTAESSSSKRVENTVGKGKIACYEQFLLFLSVFKTCAADTLKPWLVWEKVKRHHP